MQEPATTQSTPGGAPKLTRFRREALLGIAPLASALRDYREGKAKWPPKQVRRAALYCDYGDHLLELGRKSKQSAYVARARRLHRKASALLLQMLSLGEDLASRVEAAPAELLSALGVEQSKDWRSLLLEKDGDAEAQQATRAAARARIARALVRYAERPRKRLVLASLGASARLLVATVALLAVAVLVSPGLRERWFPKDKALGKPFRLSSASVGSAPTGTIESPRRGEPFFRTLDEASPWIEVDLGSSMPISAVTIGNVRSGCEECARPLWVEISNDAKTWTQVGRRRAEFTTWTAEFPKSAARYVRLRVGRPTRLHLERFSVY